LSIHHNHSGTRSDDEKSSNDSPDDIHDGAPSGKTMAGSSETIATTGGVRRNEYLRRESEIKITRHQATN
jgi:hypothetical protein